MKKLLLIGSIALTITSCLMDVERTNSASHQMDIVTNVDTLVIDNNDTVFSTTYDTIRIDSIHNILTKDTIYNNSYDTVVVKETQVDTLIELTKDTVVVTNNDTVTLNNVDTVYSSKIDTIYQKSEYSLIPRTGMFVDTVLNDSTETTIFAGREFFRYSNLKYTISGYPGYDVTYLYTEMYNKVISASSSQNTSCPVGWLNVDYKVVKSFYDDGLALQLIPSLSKISGSKSNKRVYYLVLSTPTEYYHYSKSESYRFSNDNSPALSTYCYRNII